MESNSTVTVTVGSYVGFMECLWGLSILIAPKFWTCICMQSIILGIIRKSILKMHRT